MRGRSDRTPTKLGSTRNTPRASGVAARASATRSAAAPAAGQSAGRRRAAPTPAGARRARGPRGRTCACSATTITRSPGRPRASASAWLPRSSRCRRTGRGPRPRARPRGAPPGRARRSACAGRRPRGERQVEAEQVVGEVRRALVPRRREGRDARVGQVRGGRVGERRLPDPRWPGSIRSTGCAWCGLATGFRQGSRRGDTLSAGGPGPARGRAARSGG